MSVTPWWSTWPGRLEYELAHLESAGFPAVIDEAAKARGVFRLAVTVCDELTAMGDVELVVTFPDFYPYFRPEVVAPGLALAHHQHPFGRNLCLIGRGSDWWQPRDTLAWLLTSQLPRALAAGSDSGRNVLEADQGEPLGAYYSYTPNAVMLIDSSQQMNPQSNRGTAQFSLIGGISTDPSAQRFRGAMTSAKSESGEPLFVLPEALSSSLPGRLVQGRWCRLDTLKDHEDANSIWHAASLVDPVPTAPTAFPDGNGADVFVEVRAILFS